tara:strand:+ start:726 stop:884 length:159 start_codon:yes stop_codon:yes gene_type:complete
LLEKLSVGDTIDIDFIGHAIRNLDPTKLWLSKSQQALGLLRCYLLINIVSRF